MIKVMPFFVANSFKNWRNSSCPLTCKFVAGSSIIMISPAYKSLVAKTLKNKSKNPSGSCTEVDWGTRKAWKNGNRLGKYHNHPGQLRFSSAAQSCLTLCDPMDCSTPGFPVHYQLPEFLQTHVHEVSDASNYFILSSPSPAFNHSQHQGLFQ